MNSLSYSLTENLLVTKTAPPTTTTTHTALGPDGFAAGEKYKYYKKCTHLLPPSPFRGPVPHPLLVPPCSAAPERLLKVEQVVVDRGVGAVLLLLPPPPLLHLVAHLPRPEVAAELGRLVQHDGGPAEAARGRLVLERGDELGAEGGEKREKNDLKWPCPGSSVGSVRAFKN